MSSNSDPQQTPVTGFELEQVDLYGKYMLSAPIEVLFVLRSMLRRGCMATVYFDQGRSFFLTWLLALNNEGQQIVLDVGSDDAVNRAALQATRLIVAARLDNVKVQFTLQGLSEITYEGRPAFLAAAPTALLRLQRREYFRLETSPADSLHCRIPAQAADESPHSLDLTLLDISGGGMSLMVPTELAEYFKTGAFYTDCRLEIPGENVVVATLCVRSSFIVAPRGGGPEYLRAGCEFINLPGTRLTLIQRYITRVERERKARHSGLE